MLIVSCLFKGLFHSDKWFVFCFFLSESSVWSVLNWLLVTQHLQCEATQSGMALRVVLTDAKGSVTVNGMLAQFFTFTSRARLFQKD